MIRLRVLRQTNLNLCIRARVMRPRARMVPAVVTCGPRSKPRVRSLPIVFRSLFFAAESFRRILRTSACAPRLFTGFFRRKRTNDLRLQTVQRSPLCRSRRELSNAYLLAKFGFDTAENEPCKVCPLSVYRSPVAILAQGARGVGAMSDAAAERRSRLSGGW